MCIHHFFPAHSAAGVHGPRARKPSDARTAVSRGQANGCTGRPLGCGSRKAGLLLQAPDASCGDDGPDPHHQDGVKEANVPRFQSTHGQLSGRPALVTDGHFGSSTSGSNVLGIPGPRGQRGARPYSHTPAASAQSPQSADGQTPGLALTTPVSSLLGPRAVLKLCLRNPDNLCYANSIMLALA